MTADFSGTALAGDLPAEVADLALLGFEIVDDYLDAQRLAGPPSSTCRVFRIVTPGPAAAESVLARLASAGARQRPASSVRPERT